MLSNLDFPHTWQCHEQVHEADCAGLMVLAFRREHLLLWQGSELIGADREGGETLTEAFHRCCMEMNVNPLVSGQLGQATIHIQSEAGTAQNENPPRGWRYAFPQANFAVYWVVLDETPEGFLALAPDKFARKQELAFIRPLLQGAQEIAAVVAEKLKALPHGP